MTFFNKKEEVMKIELTPYGRYLLSVGKLKPHHYRFFDENVAYDCKALQDGVTEIPSKAHERVTVNTPLLKSNPNITGVETNIRKFETDDAMVANTRVPTKDDVVNSNKNQLGTSDYKTEHAPHYRVELYRGSFKEDSISKNYTSANISNLNIPQLPLKVYFSSSIEISVSDITETTSGLSEKESFISAPFQDNSYFKISYENPIVRFAEVNGFDEKDNFILTAYKVRVDPNQPKRKIYTRLSLPKQSAKIENDLLVDDNEESVVFDNEAMGLGLFNPTELNYFLNFNIDKEISESDICATIGELKVRNIYLDERIGCPDYEQDQTQNLYYSRVRPEDLEDCD